MRSGERGVPDPIDVHVGRRVRLRRKELDLSQERLADALGITFQQVQKYERGSNRISASKLYRIAQVLHAPVSFFFEGLDDAGAASNAPRTSAWTGLFEQLAAEPNGAILAEGFLAIRGKAVRKSLAALARTLAEVDLELHQKRPQPRPAGE